MAEMSSNNIVDNRTVTELLAGEKVEIKFYDASGVQKGETVELSVPANKKFNGMVAVAGVLVDQ